MTTRVVFFGGTLAALLACNAVAQTDDEMARLKAEIQAIREQNDRLRSRLDQQDERIQSLVQALAELREPAIRTTARTDAARAADSQPEDAGETEAGSAAAPALFIRGFTDTSFVATSDRGELGEGSNGFSLNELDLLLTSQLSDELSVLSEVVFHFDEPDETSFFEVERIYLKYAPLDALNLKVGRIHTPIGYWNQTFHHGVWFQTTVQRPEIFKFEDNGGILPVHSVGIEAVGTLHRNPFDFDYSASLSNGRGESLNAVQNVRDLNRSKAVSLRINLAPRAVPGLQLGVSSYFDRFPGVATPELSGELEEQIVSGHVVYESEHAEFLAELVRVRHREELSQREFDTIGLYAQGAYPFRNFKPYYRFDYIDLDELDPIYTVDQRDLRRHTAGLRWDASTWFALKLEYNYEVVPRFKSYHQFATQGAFSF